MDNNSKDTLFGFETFTDLFSDKNQNDYSSEIDDEELERLKQNSRKNTPPTPGSKKKDEVDKEGKEGEEGEEKKETEKEDENKLNKEDESDNNNNAEDNEGEEEGDETDPDESTKVTALFDAIAEELDWEFEEGEEKPTTVEDLVEYFKDVIKDNSVPQYASEEVKELDEFVRNGGKLEQYFSINKEVDLEDFDTTTESNQKQIVKMLLAEKGFNEKQINRKIEKYEDAGILEDEAEDALEAMKDIVETKKQKLLEDQKRTQAKRQADQQRFIEDVVGEINAMDNIRGIKVPEKDKKVLLAYIFKTDADGKTQYQKDYVKSVKNLIESAYFTMKGDTLLDTAKKMGTSSAIKNLKKSLESTGVSRGKKVNTTSSDSIFSRAVKQLL